MNGLDRIGELIVCKIRDQAIEQALRILSGEHPSPLYAATQEKLARLQPEDREAVRELVSLSVDYSVIHILLLVQETTDGVGELANLLEESSLADLASLSDGLVGECVTENSWVSRYSRYQPSVLTS